MAETSGLILLAIAPGAILVAYFYRRDTLQREPYRVIFASFGLGALSVFPAAFLEDAVGVDTDTSVFAAAMASAFLLVGPIEELMKFLVIRFYSYRNFHFDEMMDGIVYGGAAGAGFATLENLFYVLDGGFAVGITRAFVSVPGHILYGTVMGYWLANGRFTGRHAWPKAIYGYLLASVAHGAFDAPLFMGATHYYWIPVAVVAALWAMTRLHLRTSLRLDHSAMGLVVAGIERHETLRAEGTFISEMNSATVVEERRSFVPGLIRAGLMGLGVLTITFGLFLGLGAYGIYRDGDEGWEIAVAISAFLLLLGASFTSLGARRRA